MDWWLAYSPHDPQRTLRAGRIRASLATHQLAKCRGNEDRRRIPPHREDPPLARRAPVRAEQVGHQLHVHANAVDYHELPEVAEDGERGAGRDRSREGARLVRGV